jgi:hypothetical protein
MISRASLLLFIAIAFISSVTGLKNSRLADKPSLLELS